MKKWFTSFGFVTAILFAFNAIAMVDMRGANYTDSWTDLRVPGVGYDLRITRTYNSRSLYSGLFGYGWCSDYETTLEVTAEGALKVTECGAGEEILYSPKGFGPKSVAATIEIIIAEVKRRRPDLKADYIENLRKDLSTNDFLREEFGRRLSLKGNVEEGQIFRANGKEAEQIALKSGVYKRILADGTYQLFDAKTGRVTYMYDRNQNYLKLSWDKSVLLSVSDNMGKKLSFKYNPMTKKVSEVVGPGALLVRYEFKGDDLVQVTDSKGNKDKYSYDDVHNLTRIDLADGTYKALTYNKDKDWVTSFRNPKGCIETYDYQTSKEDPKNHFWSLVTKKCGEKVTNKSKYEFFHKMRPDGAGTYLARVRTEVNKDVTDITYHEVFGKPLVVVRNNERTEYSYFENGLVRTKKELGRLMSFEYKNACNKVSQLTVQYFDGSDDNRLSRKTAQVKPEKVAKTVRTRFMYDQNKCNLAAADTSEGQKVKLQYDGQGRIVQIEDQAKKIVKIRYESKFGKPSFVTRPGLGTIQVSYKDDGEIAKVESKEGQNIAVQVAGIFNNLLDIISPATGSAAL